MAAGVAQHSQFAGGPRATAARLLHTVRAMLGLTFGAEPEQRATIERIRQIHQRVHGSLSGAVSPFPAGTCYSAEDPPLVLWVHLTLVESMVLVHDVLFPPLSEAERDAYCAEAAWVAHALGRIGSIRAVWST